MSRATLERRREAEKRWPTLYQMLTAYFGKDVFRKFGTLPEAREAAVSGFDSARQRQAATEWWDWNRSVGAAEDIRSALDAYGVELDFDSEREARQFMNDLYDALIVSVRAEEGGWRP